MMPDHEDGFDGWVLCVIALGITALIALILT